MVVPTCSSLSLSRWDIDAPSGATAGTEMRGISTLLPMRGISTLLPLKEQTTWWLSILMKKVHSNLKHIFQMFFLAISNTFHLC